MLHGCINEYLLSTSYMHIMIPCHMLKLLKCTHCSYAQSYPGIGGFLPEAKNHCNIKQFCFTPSTSFQIEVPNGSYQWLIKQILSQVERKKSHSFQVSLFSQAIKPSSIKKIEEDFCFDPA